MEQHEISRSLLIECQDELRIAAVNLASERESRLAAEAAAKALRVRVAAEEALQMSAGLKEIARDVAKRESQGSRGTQTPSRPPGTAPGADLHISRQELPSDAMSARLAALEREMHREKAELQARAEACVAEAATLRLRVSHLKAEQALAKRLLASAWAVRAECISVLDALGLAQTGSLLATRGAALGPRRRLRAAVRAVWASVAFQRPLRTPRGPWSLPSATSASWADAETLALENARLRRALDARTAEARKMEAKLAQSEAGRAAAALDATRSARDLERSKELEKSKDLDRYRELERSRSLAKFGPESDHSRAAWKPRRGLGSGGVNGGGGVGDPWLGRAGGYGPGGVSDPGRVERSLAVNRSEKLQLSKLITSAYAPSSISRASSRDTLL